MSKWSTKVLEHPLPGWVSWPSCPSQILRFPASAARRFRSNPKFGPSDHVGASQDPRPTCHTLYIYQSTSHVPLRYDRELIIETKESDLELTQRSSTIYVCRRHDRLQRAQEPPELSRDRLSSSFRERQRCSGRHHHQESVELAKLSYWYIATDVAHCIVLGCIDLPAEFPALRERLLRLADKFASLPEDVREKYARKDQQYM